MQRADVIVVGGGLAGLSCAFELATRGREVLLLESCPVVGGRTSSWNKDGMMVESGLHRFLGFYEALPDLLRKVGIHPDDILYWEDEVEIRLPDGRGNGVFGAAPLYRPFETLGGVLGNFELLSLADSPDSGDHLPGCRAPRRVGARPAPRLPRGQASRRFL